MANNRKLTEAAKAKNDEFYTQYIDIQNEVNNYDVSLFRDKTILLPCDDPEWSNFTRYFAANFDLFGLKKLISTSYAKNKKKFIYKGMYSLFDNDVNIDTNKERTNGKIFTLERGDNNGNIDIDDLQWRYLEGDGDFRSDEVKALRDEADIIITNPPFSKFREFLAWIMEGSKQFLIIGNINCLTYKEVFPLIMRNKIWLGKGFKSMVGFFESPYEDIATASDHREGFIRISGVLWLTNLDYKKRHSPLKLMTYQRNIKYSHHKEIKGIGYQKYDNYDAIEVPFTDAIPDDYEGVMGVPITFLDKYCPEQFEILGHTYSGDTSPEVEKLRTDPKNRGRGIINGQIKYDRILIRRRVILNDAEK